MAVRFDFSFTGDKALQALLASLPDKLERKILAGATVRAAKSVLLPAVVANTPVGAPYTRVTRGRTQQGNDGAFRRIGFRQQVGGRLRRSYKVRQLRRRAGRVGAQIVTGTRADLGIRGRGYYPAHLEFGFTPRGRAQRVTSRQRFIKNPVLTQRAAWIVTITQELKTGLEREWHI